VGGAVRDTRGEGEAVIEKEALVEAVEVVEGRTLRVWLGDGEGCGERSSPVRRVPRFRKDRGGTCDWAHHRN